MTNHTKPRTRPLRGLSDRARALAAVYAQIPTIECRGSCHDSCGPIRMTRTEHRLVTAAGVDVPDRGFESAGLSCPALTMLRRCGVYEARPVVCRLWGVVDAMPCTYGCRPARMLTMAEGYELLAQAADIDGDTTAAAQFRSSGLDDPDRAAVVTPILRKFTSGRIGPDEFSRLIREAGVR